MCKKGIGTPHETKYDIKYVNVFLEVKYNKHFYNSFLVSVCVIGIPFVRIFKVMYSHYS